MEFAGLPFAQLLTLFGVFGALTVGLYVLKLRRRSVAVPFSLLWQKILRDKEATNLFSQLKRILSLLLQLALLALLVFALGDPRPKALFRKGRTVVMLIDASASMQATDVKPSVGGPLRPGLANRLGVALVEAKRVIDSLGSADRLLVAQMDAMVTPLSPMTDDVKGLERALDLVTPTDARADFPRALRFAADTLRGVDNGEILVVSDGALGEAKDSGGEVRFPDLRLTFLPVGSGHRNLGITAFSVRRYPLDKSRYEVMFEITNSSSMEEEVELTLLGDGKIVDLTKLKLKPRERLPRFYPNLSGASRTLEAKIAFSDGSHDDLPLDDRAYALLPERQRLKVLVVTDGNTYLEAALLLDEYLEVTQISPQEYARGGYGRKKFDAVVFDRVTPLEFPDLHAFYIDPRGPGSPVKVDSAELKQPGFDKVDRKNPIVQFTALDDVNIARGHKLTPEPGDRVVGASENGPILVSGTRGLHRFVAMGFDVRESDLPLRVAWPVLLLNAINWFADEDVSYLSSFRTGEVWRIPVDPAATSALLRRMPGERRETLPVREGRAVVFGQHVGFYELTTPTLAPVASDPGGAAVRSHAVGAFAANLLDVDESDIAPKQELVVAGRSAERAEILAFRTGWPLWVVLLLVALAVTTIEWATYHRRVTV